jgi:hypothetical protein
MEITMTTKTLAGTLAALLCFASAGCGTIGPKKKNNQQSPTTNAPKEQLYEADLTKPDGPMLQMLRSAQDRDEELFRASFAPSVEASRIDADVFKKFRRKVLTNKLTPVPESVQQVSETEAIVKLRSARGREIPVHVEKVDDKWFIAKIDFGKKAIGKFKQQNEKEQPKP